MARTPLGDEDYNSTPGVFGGQTISGRDHAAEGRSLSLTPGGIMPTRRATHSATVSAPPQKDYDFAAAQGFCFRPRRKPSNKLHPGALAYPQRATRYGATGSDMGVRIRLVWFG